MNEKILKNLEQIAKAAKTGPGEKDALEAIRSARETIKTSGAGIEALQELDRELSVWQSKLSVIWSEPLGRQGIAKHATYWEEKLRSLRSAQ